MAKKMSWLQSYFFLCIPQLEKSERNKMGDGTESTPVRLKQTKAFHSE